MTSPPRRPLGGPAKAPPHTGPAPGRTPAAPAGRLLSAIAPAAAAHPRSGAALVTLRHVYRSRLPQMAAALSYRTIFGIIPVLVVGLVVLQSFTTEEDIRSLVSRALDYAGLSVIRVDSAEADEQLASAAGSSVMGPFIDDAAPGPDPHAGPDAAPTDDRPPALQTAPDDGGPGPDRAQVGTVDAAELDRVIGDLLDRVSHVPFKAIGLVGLLALIYAAISMIVEVERAFNQLYHAPAGRSWVRRVAQYWTVLTLGTLMLFATFYIGERFERWIVGDGDGGHGLLVTAGGFGLTVLISTSLFFIMYLTIPHTHVAPRAAAAGALVAAVLWEASKWAFTQYLSTFTGYALLYGSIALLPLFMLWVYVTWLIVLLGLQISYATQHFRAISAEAARRDDGDRPVVLDAAAAVLAMAAAGRAFAGGRPLRADDLAVGSGLTPAAADLVLDRLTEAGLVHRLGSDDDDDRSFALSRPPESITVASVLELGQRMARPGAEDSPDPVLDRLHRSQRDAAGDTTIADLIRAAPGPAPAGVPGPTAGVLAAGS